MNLEKKKRLAANTLGVGKERIVFNSERLAEIKEAITRQDIRDLFSNRSIVVKDVSGRRQKPKRTTRRRFGSIKKRVKNSKRDYISLVRKLRSYIEEMRKQEKITEEAYQKLRKEIRSGVYRSKAHIKEIIFKK